MITESIKLRGELEVIVRGADGQTKEKRLFKNLVVDSGLNLICSRLKDSTDNAVSHIGLGTGTTAADSADTGLESIAGTLKAIGGATVSNNSVAFSAVFDAGESTGAITEAALFNAASSGAMICRTVFAVVNKGASDSLSLNWTITLSAS